MTFRKLYILPITLFALLLVTVLITYTIAVIQDHVEPGFPYISDTGSLSPESCVFSQFLNIGAFIMVISVYIRYLHVEKLSEMYSRQKIITQKLNKIATGIGFLSCLGLDIVANFQESNIYSVHMIGAATCFGAGTVYFTIQTWISYHLPELSPRRLFYIRVVLVVITILATFLTFLMGPLAYRDYRGSPMNLRKWKTEDGGWGLHITSSISEWVLCVTFGIIILSFVPEFHNIELEAPILKFPIEEGRRKSEFS